MPKGQHLYKHGGSYTRLYRIRQNMRNRCYRKSFPRYKDYGGRGITICEEWSSSFEAFRDWALNSGYAEGLALDRKDNNGPYAPWNCRWVTSKENNLNSRRNVRLTFGGESKTIKEWADDPRCKVSGATLKRRLGLGWSIGEAITIATLPIGANQFSPRAS